MSKTPPAARPPICPHCASLDVRRSRRVGLREGLLLRLISRAPYRCLACKTRFVSHQIPPPPGSARPPRGLGDYLGIRREDHPHFDAAVLLVGLTLLVLILVALLVMAFAPEFGDTVVRRRR